MMSTKVMTGIKNYYESIKINLSIVVKRPCHPLLKHCPFLAEKCECMSNATSTSIKQFETHPDIKESAIFQLQKINVEGLTTECIF